MKQIITFVFAFLFSINYLIACQVNIVLDGTGTILVAEVSGVEDYTLVWPDGTGGETYPIPEDGEVVCVNLIANDGDCNVTACYSDVPPSECDATIYLNEDGMVCVEAIGEAPFNYFWDCGAVGACIPFMGAMDYCLTVVDAEGCVTDVCQYIQADCTVAIIPQLDGTLLVAQASGVAPYVYLWSDGHECPAITAEPGIEYCVTITDAEGCVASACYGGGEECSVSILQGPPAGNIITALAQGIAPFEYLWNTGEVESTILIEPGIEYCVTVIDATGCLAEACVFWDTGCSVDIEVVPSPGWGYLLIAHTAGAGPFNYEWSTGETESEIFVTESGSYCVTITNTVGCVTEACVFVGFPECSVLIYEYSYGEYMELLTIAGGQAPFEYFWDNGETTPAIAVTEPGLYCVQVIDGAGCESSFCYEVTFENCQVEIIEVVAPDGTMALFADGIGQGLSYTWNDGTVGQYLFNPQSDIGYCVFVANDYGCWAEACWEGIECSAEIIAEMTPDGTYQLSVAVTGQSPFAYIWSTGEFSEVIEVELPGTYCVDVIDQYGCLASACYEVIDNGECIVFIYEEQNDAGQTILHAVPITNQEFTVQWSTGAITESIEVFEPGEYCVTIVNENGTSCAVCYQYEFPVSTNDITGLVHLPDPTGSAFIVVELYLLIDNGQAELIEADTIGVGPGYDGQYFFADAPDGAYVVRAIEILGIVPSLYAPTYHFMSLTSEEAQTIQNPHSVSTWYSILMIPIEGNSEGPGEIGGSVTDGAGKSFAPESGITVLLTDLEDRLVAYTPTALKGNFGLTSLAYGEYYLIVDVPGLPMAKERVSITPEEYILHINIEVDPAGIVLGTEDELPLTLNAFPNPTVDYIQLNGLEAIAGEVNLQVFNMDGKILKRALNIDTSARIDMRDLTAALYFLRLEAEGLTQTIKIVKKN